MSVAAHRFDNDLRYRAEDHPHNTALTPPYVLEPVRELLGGIDLDPCTTPDNPTHATRFYAPPVDGAAEPWDAERIFVNPPYGKARERWVQRCIEAGLSGARVVLLMPAHTDTRVFQTVLCHARSVLFVKGRVKFGILRPNRRQVAASHPSVLVGWNIDLSPLHALGTSVDPRWVGVARPDPAHPRSREREPPSDAAVPPGLARPLPDHVPLWTPREEGPGHARHAALAARPTGSLLVSARTLSGVGARSHPSKTWPSCSGSWTDRGVKPRLGRCECPALPIPHVHCCRACLRYARAVVGRSPR